MSGSARASRSRPLADLALSLPFFERLRCPKQLTVLDNAGHLPVEQPGVHQLEQALLDLLAAVVAGTSWPSGSVAGI